ncbi:MAG: c-type cytochrome [Woeseiaceae bacterium]
MHHHTPIKSCGSYIALFLLYCALPGTAYAAPAVADTTPALTTGCADCHGVDGLAKENLDAPVISGMPAAHIEEAIYAYRDGARQCRYEPLMCETVKHTSDQRIADLAEHYSMQTRDSSDEAFDSVLAAKGEKIHGKLCKQCHLPPDDPAVADALGIPLHGQRSVYLRYALKSYLDGRRENLLETMGERLRQLDSDDIEALVNYYASF